MFIIHSVLTARFTASWNKEAEKNKWWLIGNETPRHPRWDQSSKTPENFLLEDGPFHFWCQGLFLFYFFYFFSILLIKMSRWNTDSTCLLRKFCSLNSVIILHLRDILADYSASASSLKQQKKRKKSNILQIRGSAPRSTDCKHFWGGKSFFAHFFIFVSSPPPPLQLS